jgi:alpha-amylase/alpha-mannosidase (GH57 family)
MGESPVGTPGSALPGIDLLLLWHMHQPDYRDQSTGEFTMPWVYLHALKDYSDMAWHLEQNPGMRAVVNFVPVLLDQIEDYVEQFAQASLRDPLLRLLARSEATPLSQAERRHAFKQCFRANHLRLIAPFPPFKRLFDLFTAMEAQGKESLMYLSDRYIYDLTTWYHLAWTGESVRRESEVVSRLMVKGTHFTQEDRTDLLRVIAEQVRAVIPRYRALAQRGQVEISTTPHCHPLAPLMLDFRCARDTLPDAPLPEADHYPGGEERVCAHIDSALASHARRFGAAPVGLWPAEGALSARFAGLLAARGLGWTASSQGVLGNSLRASGHTGGDAEYGIAVAHQPYRASTVAPGLLFFFRDDRLSDLIGFAYSKWHGRDAANNFVHELEAIAKRATGGRRPLVSVMLDGENAWEYYPYNGFFFLSDLYKSLVAHPGVRTVTGSDVVKALTLRRGPMSKAPPAATSASAAAAAASSAEPGVMPAADLPTLAAGSWVYGNLATWIGARDKNRAWDLLCAAKTRYDAVIRAGTLGEAARAHALAQLADCEASDWFWWPGEDNPGESVSAFESLFRSKLANLYRLLELPVPEDLGVAFSAGAAPGGGTAEIGGTMRRGSGE